MATAETPFYHRRIGLGRINDPFPPPPKVKGRLRKCRPHRKAASLLVDRAAYDALLDAASRRLMAGDRFADYDDGRRIYKAWCERESLRRERRRW